MVTTLLFTIDNKTVLYFPRTRLNQLLKPSKNRFSKFRLRTTPCVFFRIIAHNAGVSVKAITPERMIDVAMVTENWR